jgi:hypothetical protein
MPESTQDQDQFANNLIGGRTAIPILTDMSGRKEKKSSSGAGSSGVFISFADVADEPPDSPHHPAIEARGDKDAPESSVYYNGPYPQIALLCRRIMKKDGSTKLKALKELRGVIKVSRQASCDCVI